MVMRLGTVLREIVEVVLHALVDAVLACRGDDVADPLPGLWVLADVQHDVARHGGEAILSQPIDLAGLGDVQVLARGQACLHQGGDGAVA
eukprot:14175131-Alexandrium_andersonii.AAC.1